MNKKGRKRNAIHSGIGDNDDLFIKRPVKEDVTEDFRYAARLRGKKRHDTMIHPEVPFEYGVSYTGETLETYNEKEYEFGINAHPEKTIGYRIEETKELPVKKLWEAKACFEAEVIRHNMKYAVNYKGHTGVIDKRTAEYAVNWNGEYTVQDMGDVKDLFTDARGRYVGYSDGTTGWHMNGTHVDDLRNRAFFSGVIATDMYSWDAYEAEFNFKPILNDGAGIFGNTKRFNWSTHQFYSAGKWDDDVVGLIFQAKDAKNFYMMFWEAEERIWGSSRAGSDLDGIDIFTQKDEYVDRSVVASGYPPTYNQWVDYCNNKGWGKWHRRIYKVTDGVLKRVNVPDLGNGAGWIMNNMHNLKVVTSGNNVKIYGNGSLFFDFNTDWGNGSFGMFNVSQSVEFHNINVIERRRISGRIPASGWDTTTSTSNVFVTSNATSYVKNSDNFKSKLPAGISASQAQVQSITPVLNNYNNGNISIGGLTGAIVVVAKDYSTWKDYSGRFPSSGYYEFDGIGDHQLTANAQEFVRQQTGIAGMIVDSIEGTVQDSKTGTLIIQSKTGAIIARNNNAPDAGAKYNKCYIRCGIVEITPDHRDYSTGLLVFADIATVFADDYKEFFNREDYINKKATYELLQPVWIDPPKPPPIAESPGGCVIEEPVPPEEEPVVKCLNEFDFDGKKLVMWECDFPTEIVTKLFEDKVFAYRGWTTFNPLVNFSPNQWTVYKLIPIEATIDPEYDEVKWAGRTDYDKAPVGTKVIMRTKEWYKAIFPADIVNQGIVNSELNLISEIPPAPEHFYHPTITDSRMPDHFETIHYLLDAWENHADVVVWFESNPSLTTDTADKRQESLAHEGRLGMPIILTSSDIDRVVIHCKEDPRYIPWASGKYIGYGKVNGKRPFWGAGAGKADMINVSTEGVFFPENLVHETLQGPFIDIYDKEYPDKPRVEYRLHSENKLIDFYSSHTDAHIWYTDWYSKWVEDETPFQATMYEPTHIKNPLDLDPMSPEVSDDYNPDNTIIERIEVTSNNPFVKLWIEDDKSKNSGLLGTYYRYPLTANVYEEEWQVTGDYKEWVQEYEIKSYMDKIEIPLKHEEFNILEVKIDETVIPQASTGGWRISEGLIKLDPNIIEVGMLRIKYSTGGVVNLFTLEKKLGTYSEVYVNGVLLDSVDYSFSDNILVINKSQLFLHDWVHLQSYDLNELYDQTKRQYLGEKLYSQLDFQEDVPTNPTNPNYGDTFYEGSFCYNWGYNRPKGIEVVTPSGFKQMSMYLPEDISFKFNIDMEIVYPVSAAIDISNFTGTWTQWDVDPIIPSDPTSLAGPGDWHGPPEPGFPEVTNLKNQSLLSGWYNPEHVGYQDYDFSFKVQARQGDDDMYGAIFKFDPVTQNFYSFEWDGYWGLEPPAGGTGVKGMSIYKNICSNPQDAGVARLNYTRTVLAHADISWTPGDAEIHEIKVSTIADKMKVWTDGILRFDIQDTNNPFFKGAWGPVTQSQPNTYFWDFWMQTYRRITPKERPSFRKVNEITKNRHTATGDDPWLEIELDPQNMGSKFQSILDSYCAEAQISLTDIISREFYIREDTSDYEVYFKDSQLPGEKLKIVREALSKLYSTVKGQYPETGDPSQLPVPSPVEPDVPDLIIPTEGDPDDGFTISWNGYIFAAETGIYKFRVTVNDGFRLWIRGEEIINEWNATGEPNYFPDYEASIYLEGGKWHSIRANYFENIGQALIRLHWAQPGKEFERISPNFLTPYLGYKLFAQVKKARPLPWNPMIHNGYYYHEEREHYLYAQKIVHKKTPNTFHELTIEPRPQQGSSIIVRDNEGNNLRKVAFYDDNWNLTLENKEVFSGNGYAKYYLNYRGIDKATVKVRLNGTILLNSEYIFNEDESSIEFMEEISAEDEIDVRYILLYSYYLDMNADIVDDFVNKDMARIKLHSNYDPAKMVNMEIIYEAAKETPFYKAAEVVFNPILNHNHTGFLYLTEVQEQDVKDMTINLSDKTLSNIGLEKVLLTVRVSDKYNNPCPNKLVKIWRDGILIGEDYLTNDTGEVYLYDMPTPTESKISIYKVTCESITKEALLNYYVDNQIERHYMDVVTQKLSILAGVDDEAIISVTLRDKNWNPVSSGKTIKVEYRDSYGNTRTENLLTDAFGHVDIRVSGEAEQHGNIMVKASYNMGFEETANYVYLKVIGG